MLQGVRWGRQTKLTKHSSWKNAWTSRSRSTRLWRNNLTGEAKYPMEWIIKHIRTRDNIPYVVRWNSTSHTKTLLSLPITSWSTVFPDVGALTSSTVIANVTKNNKKWKDVFNETKEKYRQSLAIRKIFDLSSGDDNQSYFVYCPEIKIKNIIKNIWFSVQG